MEKETGKNSPREEKTPPRKNEPTTNQPPLAEVMAKMVTKAAFQEKTEEEKTENSKNNSLTPKTGDEPQQKPDSDTEQKEKPVADAENKPESAPEREKEEADKPETGHKSAEEKEPQKPDEPTKKGKATEEFYDFGEDSTDDDDDDDDEQDHPGETDQSKEKDLKKKEETLPDYDRYDREKLVKELEELVNLEDVLEHKQKIALIKVAYLKKTEEAKTEELEKLSEGAEKKQSKSKKSMPEASAQKEKQPEKELTDGKNVTEALSQEKTDKEQDQKNDPEKETQKKAPELTLEERFNNAFGKYKEKRASFLKEQDQQQKENLEKKKGILEELRQLINSEETLKKTYDNFKALQAKWKEIGMVPKQEVNELWKNYHFLVEKFFDKVKINKELRDLDLKKNLEQKISLCEKAEELILEKSVNKSFKQLQELHEKYRVTGPVPDEHKEEVWNRFKAATEKIHDRRRQHYKNKEEEQQKNLDAKTALCEKMETVLKNECETIKDYNNITNQVRELMKIWRSVGFAPKQHNDQIWKRFKTAVDSFFEQKKEFFDQLKEEQRENYNRKVNLCLEAESLQDSSEWKKTTSALINLQKEWKKIGPVSRKHSDKLWKRFRTANDVFFSRKEEYFKNIKDREKDNLEKKLALIQKIKKHPFGDDKNENLKVLKEIQREWMETGFVPISKKDEIQKQYQDEVDKRMDELSISRVEVNQDQYKNRVSKLKEIDGGDRQLRKERGILVKKINKLKEDVQLWENNTGFLANTKNADILKQEFQKKIDNTRKEIALLEAQIKILDKG